MTSAGILSLLPATVTILVALRWRRVATALFAGIVTGALLVASFSPAAALRRLLDYLWASVADLPKLKIVLFILLIGGLLEVVGASGAPQALAERLSARIHSPRRARLTVWGLSFLLFFDDYANVLVTGAALRPVTDRNRVSRPLLAYLVDVLAVLASVMLVSTWAAFEISLLTGAGQGIGRPENGVTLFIQALPFHFYTFLAVGQTLLVAWSGRWLGRGAVPEERKREEEPASPPEGGSGATLVHALAPIVILIGAAVLGLFASGAFFAHRRGLPLTPMAILGNAPSVDVLICATVLSTLVGIFLLRRDGVLSRRKVRHHYHRGLASMGSIGMVILLATGLAQASGDLGTGPFLATTASHGLPAPLLPLVIFLIALLVTVATGFSWSSMAIVMPIAFQLAAAYPGGNLISMVAAAVITGAVAGEHLVPYSEKTVLTAAACGIAPVLHWRTQVGHAVLAAFCAAGGFLLAGLGLPAGLALLPSFLLLAAVLRWRGARK